MNNQNVCIRCGSFEFVSDRSLGGRIICARCGSTTFRRTSSIQLNNKKIFYLIIFIIVILIIIIK